MHIEQIAFWSGKRDWGRVRDGNKFRDLNQLSNRTICFTWKLRDFVVFTLRSDLLSVEGWGCFCSTINCGFSLNLYKSTSSCTSVAVPRCCFCRCYCCFNNHKTFALCIVANTISLSLLHKVYECDRIKDGSKSFVLVYISTHITHTYTDAANWVFIHW